MNGKIFIISLLIILSSTCSNLWDFTNPAAAASDNDGILTVDTKLVVSGIYNQVRVKGSGHMIVESELETSSIILEKGSKLELLGGKIKICDTDTPGAPVSILGSCRVFRMVDGAELSLSGTLGSNDIGKSTGGDVEFSLEISEIFNMTDSTIILNGGNGYSKSEPGADTTDSISDYQYAGGNASTTLEIGTAVSVFLKNSKILISGGPGSKAPDGQISISTAGGSGGGYSNGGNVSGNVGSGGFARLQIISGSEMFIQEMNFTVLGGNGGDAGDGNISASQHGGGGGGYSGGNGGTYKTTVPKSTHGQKGGDVFGRVGVGGSADFEIISKSKLELQNSNVNVRGGAGGNAGPHSSKPAVKMPGGAGGGGYGGGGGGAGLFSTTGSLTSYGGAGGNISGYVGSGGNARINLEIDAEIIIDNAEIELNGGSGGSGGTGSTGLIGGGGGGGFGGGGGAGGSLLDGAAVYGMGGSGGSVSEKTGAGGDSVIFINSTDSIYLYNARLAFYGGDGGSAGAGGKVENASGGAGGGGFGGGGGGGKNGDGPGGGGGNSSIISGNVASGGTTRFGIFAENKLSVVNGELIGRGGAGGSYGQGGKYISGKGGGGGGGFGGGGGGGGGAAAEGGPGGNCSVISNMVAASGGASLKLQAVSYSISSSSELHVQAGSGAYCSAIPGGAGGLLSNGYGEGGSGAGHNADTGAVELVVPMGTPELIEPVENALVTTAYPTFSWIPQHNSTIFGSLTGHRLEVDETPGFKSPVVLAFCKTGQYSLMNPLDEGDYYWRVRAEYGANSAGWSAARKFTVDQSMVYFRNLGPVSWVSGTEPNCTVEIGDLHTAVDVSSIRYSYSTTDTGEDSFSQWLEPDMTINLAGNYSRLLSSARPALSPGSDNYIRWRAGDLAGNDLNQSPVLNVKIDTEPPIITFLEPENGSYIGSNEPVFKWSGFDIGSGISGNCSVKVFKIKAGGAVQNIFEHNGTVEFNSSSVFSFRPPASLEYGTYEIRISIEDNAGLWSASSDNNIFNIDTVRPTVEGVAPADGAWSGSKPGFRWSAMDSFAGTSDEFVFELAGDIGFKKLLFHIDGGYNELNHKTGDSYCLDWTAYPPLEHGMYYWRVKMLGNEGLWSNFSEPLGFRVDDEPPYAVAVIPQNGSWINDELSIWFYAGDDGSGISDVYRLQLAEEPNFAKAVFDETVAGNLLTKYSEWANESRNNGSDKSGELVSYRFDYKFNKMVYYWRVFASDNVGLWSAPTTPREILVDKKEPAVRILSPHRNEWMGAGFEIIWSASDELSGLSGIYNLQVSTNREFSDTIVNVTLTGSSENNVENRYTPSEITSEGLLYFRINTKDNAGNICPFTNPEFFKLDLTGIDFKAVNQKKWYNTRNVSFDVELLDSGAGVDCENIYYRTSESGVASYSNWQKVEFSSISVEDRNKILVSVNALCSEGPANFIQFRAKDKANDDYMESPNYRLFVDVSASLFSEPLPPENEWQSNTYVNCGITIFDLLSGVDTDSIYYRYTTEGTQDMGEWQKYNGSYQRKSSGEVVCHLKLGLVPGEDNYIQWRVMDNAGNGFYESGIYQIKVGGMVEGEHEKKLEPGRNDEGENGWGWFGSGDGIFIFRLVLIMIVMLVLICLLRRHTSGENKLGSPRGSTRIKNHRTGPGTGTDNESLENFEDIMQALEHELTGSYTTRKSGQRRGGKANCFICSGTLHDEGTCLHCTCGKSYHVDCVSRFGRCKNCGKII